MPKIKRIKNKKTEREGGRGFQYDEAIKRTCKYGLTNCLQ